MRRLLHARGLGYRVDVAALPGRPDLVFPRARVVVFVDGDFWHGKDLDVRIAKLSSGHNAPYWIAKIRGNAARDRRHDVQLSAAGWLVLRFWESDVGADATGVARHIADLVSARGWH